MTNLFLYLTLLAYFSATALCLGFFLAQRESLCRYGALALAAGLAAHTVVLLRNALAYGYLPVGTFGDALSLFGWVLVAAFLFLNWRYPIKVLGALVAPLAALLVSASLILPRGQGALSPVLQGFLLGIHIALTLTGIAALALAFLGGIFYLIQDREIKRKKFGFFYRRLPSLTQLDTLNYWCLTIGFPLLTAGIVTGSLFAQNVLGSFFNWDPKEVLTLFAWLIYAVLLHERLTVGWRGRRAALMAIFGFLVLICTFVGANLWVDSYHTFGKFLTRP